MHVCVDSSRTVLEHTDPSRDFLHSTFMAVSAPLKLCILYIYMKMYIYMCVDFAYWIPPWVYA